MSKKMNKTLSKKQILKALKEEPLHGGDWIDLIGEYDDYDSRQKKAGDVKCTVCAVGGVLRSAFGNQMTVNDIAAYGRELLHTPYQVAGTAGSVEDARNTAEEDLKEHHPHMAVLSNFFESLWDLYGLDYCEPKSRGSKMKALRYQMQKLVKEEFPDRVSLKV